LRRNLAQKLLLFPYPSQIAQKVAKNARNREEMHKPRLELRCFLRDWYLKSLKIPSESNILFLKFLPEINF